MTALDALAAPVGTEGGGVWLTHPATGIRAPARQVTIAPGGDVASAVLVTMTGDVTSPALLGLTVPPGAICDDDDADAVMAAFGYAWAVNADPKRTGPFELRQSLWAPDLSAVVVDVDLTGRRGVTRTNADAFVDLTVGAVTYLLDGSPVRADGDRLFEAPLPDLTHADLRLWVAYPTRP